MPLATLGGSETLSRSHALLYGLHELKSSGPMLGVECRAGKVQVHDSWRALIRHPAQEVEVDFSHKCAKPGISRKRTAC